MKNGTDHVTGNGRDLLKDGKDQRPSKMLRQTLLMREMLLAIRI